MQIRLHVFVRHNDKLIKLLFKFNCFIKTKWSKGCILKWCAKTLTIQNESTVSQNNNTINNRPPLHLLQRFSPHIWLWSRVVSKCSLIKIKAIINMIYVYVWNTAVCLKIVEINRVWLKSNFEKPHCSFLYKVVCFN